MRVQIDRFEDNSWAVLLPYPDGRKTFDVPRELLPEEVSAGDVFEIRFEYDREETLRIAEENRRLLDELLGGEQCASRSVWRMSCGMPSTGPTESNWTASTSSGRTTPLTATSRPMWPLPMQRYCAGTRGRSPRTWWKPLTPRSCVRPRSQDQASSTSGSLPKRSGMK